MVIRLIERLEQHLYKLSKEIGPRPGGSDGNVAAASYIRETLELSGLEVELQEIPCTSWESQDARLMLDDIPHSLVVNPYSPPCDVRGMSVPVATIDELESLDFTEKIAVLHGDLTRRPLSPRAWFLTSGRDKRIIQLLEEKAPLAVIAIQQRCGEVECLIEDPDFALPSATVTAETGLSILKASAPAIGVRNESTSASGTTWNVIGRTTGKSDQRIALCAHYDTKFGTPGALDNAGGVSVLLALAEQSGSVGHVPSFEFIAFGNEESLPEGTEVYLRDHGDTLGDVLALLNFDGVGHALDVNTVTVIDQSNTLQEILNTVLENFPSMTWAEPWVESNHGLFAWRGVPCIAFTSPATRHLSHLREDTVRWVSLKRLEEVAEFASQTLARFDQRFTS
jgi:aminopeptidase YwaD